LDKMNLGLPRLIPGYDNLSSHAFILSGIRRCGKSTLMQQIHSEMKEPAFYLNFEDPRLAGFDLGDLNRLQKLATDKGVETYFFDEIQAVDQWESFVRFRLDEGSRIFLTGSNASMLSRDLGTKLTGRHISKELFPFSYQEYLTFTNQKPDPNATESYLVRGGFPEYLKTGLPEVLMHIFNDIIIRDIASRYNIKNVTALQQLAVWLISNCGKPFTGNSLRKIFQIGSSSSIMEYLGYLSDAYLFFYVPLFSYSAKVQMVNPRKIYAIDNGLIVNNSLSFNEDRGRLLENMVFLSLRRASNEIFYFSGRNECDFVVFQQKKLRGVYQVCWQLNEDTLDRELAGILDAMEFFGLDQGSLITFNQTDTFHINGKTVNAVAFHEWAGDER